MSFLNGIFVPRVIFHFVITFSGNFFQIGESAIMSLELNHTGNILYSAVGNSVKMVDLKT